MTQPQAVIVVTGSELVRGDRNDLNGPFLARELVARGLEPARILVVGDRGADLEGALREGLAADLCLVSGGLGPTHDDRTVEVLAALAGRRLCVDPELEREIEAVSRMVAERLRRPYGDFVPGVRKQASLPEGALALGLAGTAPGVVLEADGCVAVALPGPPGELQRLWARAVETEPVRRVLARAERTERLILRFFGLSESAVARVLDEAGGEGGGLEATVCAREFEVNVDLVAERGAEARAQDVADALRGRLEAFLFAEDARPVEELVLEAARRRGLTLATAESCTGGLVAARLTSVPGSSDVFVGGVVAYANEVKLAELDVSAEVLERHGAVSAEAAAAMADGTRRRYRADVAVSVTGIAGPGGGTPEKPVGLVYVHAAGPDEREAVELSIPGDREAVRARATVTALHALRRLLTQSRHTDV